MTKAHAFTTLEGVVFALRTHHSESKSWPSTGRAFGISGGTACRIAKGDYEPREERIRKALGLPVYAEAQVCPTHGVVHVARRCPRDGARAPRAPRRRWFAGNYVKRQG